MNESSYLYNFVKIWTQSVIIIIIIIIIISYYYYYYYYYWFGNLLVCQGGEKLT